MSQELQRENAILEEAMGLRGSYLRRAWRVREPGRYGFITLEEKGRDSYYSLYLLLDGLWSHLIFKREEEADNINQAPEMRTVVEMAVEDGNLWPRLQLLMEEERNRCLWLIYWNVRGGRVLLASVRTSLEPFMVVI